MSSLARVGRIGRRQVRDAALNTVVSSALMPRGLRWRLMRACGLSVARSTINAGMFVGGTNVTIGEGAFINYGIFIDNAASVVIGSRVSFGPRVTIITGSHVVGSADRRAGTPVASPVIVENGAWLGAGVIVLPGVTVGEGSIVAAGSVVTADVPPNTLVAGAPAVVKRALGQ